MSMYGPPYYPPNYGPQFSPTPWAESGRPPSEQFREAYKFWRKVEKNNKKDKDGEKKDDKKKSVLSTAQWIIITTGLLPLCTPLYVWLIIAIWTNMADLIRTAVH